MRPMTGEELRTLRESLGLSTEKFGRALGYQGAYGIASRHIGALRAVRGQFPRRQVVWPRCFGGTESLTPGTNEGDPLGWGILGVWGYPWPSDHEKNGRATG